jgi:hypothetical protein
MAGACGFHGAMGDGFSAMHPRSLEVAFAVREAADQGRLDAALLDVRAAGVLGVVRATKHLRELGLQLGENPEAWSAAPSMTLLFVESALWARYARSAQGMTPQVHIQGPEAGDVVVVTSEAVINAILAGRLSAGEAMNRGLMVLDGPGGAVQAAAARLAKVGTAQAR